MFKLVQVLLYVSTVQSIYRDIQDVMLESCFSEILFSLASTRQFMSPVCIARVTPFHSLCRNLRYLVCHAQQVFSGFFIVLNTTGQCLSMPIIRRLLSGCHLVVSDSSYALNTLNIYSSNVSVALCSRTAQNLGGIIYF